MSLVIKGGTIVAADRTYSADILVDKGAIQAIGEGLKGERQLDAAGCYVMPGGIDPHTHLDMPFMGANSADDFEHGTRAGLSGGTTMVVDFCIPGHGQPLMEALADWDKRARARPPTIRSTCASPIGPTRCARTWRRSSRAA